MREVFAHAEFRKLFFSNLFSGFGQGMTMIGIAWYLVETTGSAQLLGSTMFVSAVLMFFIGPYIGTLIDRYSRKKMLLVENLIGFGVLGVLAVWGFFGEYQEWMLITIYLVTTFMYQIHYPAQSALVQETFKPKHYNDINSLLEIEGQTASVLAGAFSGLLLGKFGLSTVVLFNALTYLFAFCLLSTMKYTFTLEGEAKLSQGVSWISQFGQSWSYIKEKKGFLVFGICALMPFIAVMASNLLKPVYVSQTLQADVSVFSFGEMAYALGAVAAGILVSVVVRKMGQLAAMVANTLLFAVMIVVMVALPYGWALIGAYMFYGWSNASVRLIRQSLYMTVIPKQFMGRVMSFFNSLGMMMRLVLIGVFTVMIDYTGAGMGYLVLAGLLLLAAVGVAATMRFLLADAKDQAAVATQEG
ncbi:MULTISPECIES: MFS transporter [Brevibacillus]|jgi:Major Facilitator Superfamily.|uniref:MFS transporter n=1 Tax=Brevibacillus parabrevis TaxID=54914 RepID=A0A4Y3PLF4_BREPA|nr:MULTISPECIES: MFS transporter [Brevibacillus]MDH6351008.1 MFS family permease [Brevibacillus sp. 1238]MDR4997747.1 MFS transporter [Brevibacillus parabrevis]NRQ53339.1 MFS transporter [Brevibacillus sp. HD1.4A]RNB97228.1 MFS transporter [Brevibacillus parabrevis]GEB31261.1 MFS transporter [Brevibacillus parabrevis]